MSADPRHVSPGSSLKLCCSVQSQCGLTYLGLMFFIVLMGIFASAGAQQWSFILKRDREAELLFRGGRIKHAIEKFVADYEVKKAERDHAFPRSLEELTKPTPYLQAVYTDPITEQAFELIMNEEYVSGVKSRSKETPLNRKAFKEAKTYNEVVFKAEVTSRQNCTRGLNGLSRLNESSFQTGGQGLGMQSGTGGCQSSGVSTTGQGRGEVPGSGTNASNPGASGNSVGSKPQSPNEPKSGAADNNGTFPTKDKEENGSSTSPPNPRSSVEPSSSY